MRVLEPTLVLTSAVMVLNNAGGTEELDFDFGNLEGAKLMGVEYSFSMAASTAGTLEAGLNFNGGAAAPAAADALRIDSNLFAQVMISTILTTSGLIAVPSMYRDLSLLGFVITSNIALQGFGSAATTRNISARLYFKRVIFTQSEVGTQIALRR